MHTSADVCTSDLVAAEQRLLWSLRNRFDAERGYPGLHVQLFHRWFGLAMLERALSTFERLVADIEDGLSEVFGSPSQVTLSRGELSVLSLVAACQDGPCGFGDQLARRMVGIGPHARLMVDASSMGQLMLESGDRLPVRLAQARPAGTERHPVPGQDNMSDWRAAHGGANNQQIRVGA